jgi:hypothetical protein
MKPLCAQCKAPVFDLSERQYEREIDFLLDQNEALSADAERFRWLAQNAKRVDFKNKSFAKDRLLYLTLYIDKEMEEEFAK